MQAWAFNPRMTDSTPFQYNADVQPSRRPVLQGVLRPSAPRRPVFLNTLLCRILRLSPTIYSQRHIRTFIPRLAAGAEWAFGLCSGLGFGCSLAAFSRFLRCGMCRFDPEERILGLSLCMYASFQFSTWPDVSIAR